MMDKLYGIEIISQCSCEKWEKRKTELMKFKFCFVLKNKIPLVSLMSSQS